MSKNPTHFTRKFVETCAEYKICTMNAVRDYDILMEHKKGKAVRIIADKFNLTEKQIYNIIKKNSL